MGVFGNKVLGKDVCQICGVTRDPERNECVLRNNMFSVSESNKIYDEDLIPFSFKCPVNGDHPVHGSYNPLNDAQNNAHITLEMFKNWNFAAPWPKPIKIILVFVVTRLKIICGHTLTQR